MLPAILTEIQCVDVIDGKCEMLSYWNETIDGPLPIEIEIKSDGTYWAYVRGVYPFQIDREDFEFTLLG